ncbi:MAG TPA: nicotinate (nicotinamide) nucleotide adenylyltransferase [Bryobacteraceae bacterium]|nr:nicotinate (nicotinamide) nucleotide adenylyltransferase [Bryobacteraceae bacterium]
MKLGIFGGTFDPVHSAHIAIAETARDKFALDRVLVIPAANPPHKAGATADYEHRYRMVELACAGKRALEPSRLEEGTERSYSIHTIERVRAEVGSDWDLFFVIGADAFAEITSWHRWRDVVASVEFVVVTRPLAQFVVPEGSRVHMLEDLLLPVSSSELRATLAAGQRPEALPATVYDYILEHHLYE